MATKILIWAGYLVGVPSFILGYIFSRATWKNDLLLTMGGAYWLIYGIFFFIKRYDEMKIRRMRMKEEAKKNEWEQKIRDVYGPDLDRNFN